MTTIFEITAGGKRRLETSETNSVEAFCLSHMGCTPAEAAALGVTVEDVAVVEDGVMAHGSLEALETPVEMNLIQHEPAADELQVIEEVKPTDADFIGNDIASTTEPATHSAVDLITTPAALEAITEPTESAPAPAPEPAPEPAPAAEVIKQAPRGKARKAK